MATKVIGPIVQRGDGPMKDNSKDCATGWCDPKFPAPKDWGAVERQPGSKRGNSSRGGDPD